MSQSPVYPSRTYPYRARRAADVSLEGVAVGTPIPAGQPGLKARLVGIDPPSGRDLTIDELARLSDPLALLLLKRGTFPTTLQELLNALNAFNNDTAGLPLQSVFMISEWGQIPLNSATQNLVRQLRYVVARRNAASAGATVLVSTAPPSDDRDIFLQVAAWDSDNEVFHYYERGRGGATWFWEGNSWHALTSPTRGNGPFDSHVNGAPVMKERKAPWLHWNSVTQEIPRENFPAQHPINCASETALFNSRQNADLLQTQIVEPAVRRWTDARLRRVLAPTGISDPAALIRQALTATSVNIASAPERGQSTEVGIRIPSTMFADTDTLVDILLPDTAISPIKVPRPIYAQAIAGLKVSLRDTQQGFEQPGDAFFAWPVPERAFEDIVVVDGLVQSGVFSMQFATALLMCDFSNPIDSNRRAALMNHVPSTTVDATGNNGLQAKMLQSMEVTAAAKGAGSDEAEIGRFMRLSDGQWQADAQQRITSLIDVVIARAGTPEGVSDYLRLADWRRRSFRRNRHLAEFDLSLPFSSVADDAPGVELTLNGRVVPRDAVIA
jgi:hypothetical protein